MAQLHGHSLGSFGYFGARSVEPFPFPGWWSFRRDLLLGSWATYIRRRMPEEFLARCAARVNRQTASFRDDEPTCLIHCDFRLGNILRRRASGELVVIDFESARERDGAYDFVKVWEQLGEGPLWAPLLEGYASERPLPARLDEKLHYYWFDLNYGLLYWAIDRGDEALFQSRLAVVEKLLAASGD